MKARAISSDEVVKACATAPTKLQQIVDAEGGHFEK